MSAWVVKMDATQYYAPPLRWEGTPDINKAKRFHKKKEALAKRQDMIRCKFKNASIEEVSR